MWKTEKSSVVAHSTMTNKFEDRPPSTYSMKIQSISQLKTLFRNEGFKSRSFSSGKYNWKLVIYPKGNEKDNGKGFISMYVELDSTSLDEVVSIILAYLTFFVYNKKENKYFTIQDVEGKQFNALRPVWGFSQVLPLETFNDPENGYVFDGDQCEFGVDVMVPLTNWEVVSFEPKPLNPKFSWTVNKFSKLKLENNHTSKKFKIEGRKWELKLYRENRTLCESIAIYLKLADNETMKEGEMIYVRAVMRILDPFGCNHVTRKLNDWYQKATSLVWGNDFMSLAKLREAYLDKKDSLKIEIEFEVISTSKYSS